MADRLKNVVVLWLCKKVFEDREGRWLEKSGFVAAVRGDTNRVAMLLAVLLSFLAPALVRLYGRVFLWV